MRKSAKELKEWLNTIDDTALISLDIYSNKKTKEIILATIWDENLKEKDFEFVVAEVEND